MPGAVPVGGCGDLELVAETSGRKLALGLWLAECLVPEAD